MLFFIKTKPGDQPSPCLYINEQPMFESADIMDWLEENIEKIKGA
jgi:hypothetical protein